MATQTSHLNLVKPDGSEGGDFVNIDVINDNMDVIDQHIEDLEEDSGWTSLAAFTTANFNDSGSVYRVLMGKIVDLRFTGTWSGGTVSPGPTGNIPDTNILSGLPSAIRPGAGQPSPKVTGHVGGSKYIGLWEVTSTGNVVLAKVTGSANDIVNGDGINGSVMYMLG